MMSDPPPPVASREGGVDRNVGIVVCADHAGAVASREGGVDRNRNQTAFIRLRAHVASREGGVDRNSARRSAAVTDWRRLPRGGRGSQQRETERRGHRLASPPARGRGSQLI